MDPAEKAKSVDIHRVLGAHGRQVTQRVRDGSAFWSGLANTNGPQVSTETGASPSCRRNAGSSLLRGAARRQPSSP